MCIPVAMRIASKQFISIRTAEGAGKLGRIGDTPS
jgi:hypothetical protein